MNGLDALATVAKEGAGIVRVPSWQAEADLAAGHMVRRLAGQKAGAGAGAPDVSAVAALPRKSGPSSIILLSADAEPIRSARRHGPINNEILYSILRPCQVAVVYQAAESISFRSPVVMNSCSIQSHLVVARTDSTP
jgi:hypothetical protein